MTTPKKVERGTLWFGRPEGRFVGVRSVNGKKFSYEEQKAAVGGYIESMMPVVNGRQIWVNEEGRLEQLPLNVNTWLFADRHVYVDLNAYAPTWQVSGNALEVFRVPDGALATDSAMPTIAEVLRAESEACDA